MEEVVVQAFLHNEWIDIATITLPNSSEGDFTTTTIEYTTEHALTFFEADNNHAASINYPVNFFFDDHGLAPGWLKFLDDIVPAGASRRYWIKYLDLAGLSFSQQTFVLLKHGTMSPIGNLRIKDSLPPVNQVAEKMKFAISDVVERDGDFLSYAQSKGAAAGGATGAGGEAPKLLLRCSENEEIWIDTFQDDTECRDLHYLVKFPRGQRSEADCNILRAEYYFYHELTEMGFSTIPIDNMRLEEGTRYPSLWLPRFDIKFLEDNQIKRFAMESVYSMMGAEPGTTLYHQDCLEKIISIINNSNMVANGFKFDIEEFVIEWVRRDLLNIVFGNSDNHGRNTSFLRDENGIWLAPIYDFAPMKADAEGIIRTTKWRDFEVGGEYDFIGISKALNHLVPQEKLISALCQTSKQLIGLRQRLEDKGLPKQILDMPAIGLNFVEKRLEKWGLLTHE
ncbi:HipA domain-containing protein [uncultured Photobacterium sp.]|uniref:type II toxin-antitoxin system HipA family toxin n=1 Tax=uncultured Photobacterium sp. TaxID=173973 RepID=UPI002628D7B1|nr:HipA domain-containing protein [uncultured Photobacterium sp.]